MKDSLSDLMQKRPFYKEVNVTLELLSYNPKVAFLRAMAGLFVSSEKLHSVIEKRNLAYEDYKET
ncbi:hypothetical protein PN36_09630 [Candidatus Thiomargarita nelsonii]|uniref:Uncharacterized protein n=1 Tax=Candidatus Thiomargarita nelsonii TaxID=1003181 RepID=A0A0A6PD60_9GAMM|nr:hypothetical protein PN36_09630 [Candidatus Thiomargarita nelsonii]